jgi:outer membrane protein assembly factor BamA
LPDLDSEFSFTRGLAEASLFHPLNRYADLEIQTLLGASSGELPLYRQFYLGGYRWLRGYERFEFVGDAFWAAAVDYGIDLRAAGLDQFTFWLFYDVGSIRGLDSERRYYNSVGLGLSIDRTIRLNFAHRLDRSDPDIRFSVDF